MKLLLCLVMVRKSYDKWCCLTSSVSAKFGFPNRWEKSRLLMRYEAG